MVSSAPFALATVEWRIPVDEEPGTYRIIHRGSEGLLGLDDAVFRHVAVLRGRTEGIEA
jgi:hypothetical protein